MKPFGMLLVVSASTAWATSTFPLVVERELGLPGPLPQQCGLCHQNNVTVASATVTPVALSLKSRGAVANDEAKLRAALGQLRDELVDSDGDGCTDVDELLSDTDPNARDCGEFAGGGGAKLPAPRYG